MCITPERGFLLEIKNIMFDYLRDTKAELKHVKWPTRSQAIAYSIVVIVFSLLTAIVLGGFDYLFAKLIRLFI